jgi:hypothetical protein
MPWTPKDAHRHNHGIQAGSHKAHIWSKVANSVLQRTGNEGLAMREANGVAGHGGLQRERTNNYRNNRTHRGRFGG